MGYEFDDAELTPCDVCGEIWPYDEIVELNDGRLVCPECMEKYGRE